MFNQTAGIDQDEILTAVGKRYRASVNELCTSNRRPMRAKQVAIYLLRKYTALTNQAIGEKFGMKYSAVSKAGMTIERLTEKDKSLRRDVQAIISSFEV